MQLSFLVRAALLTWARTASQGQTPLGQAAPPGHNASFSAPGRKLDWQEACDMLKQRFGNAAGGKSIHTGIPVVQYLWHV